MQEEYTDLDAQHFALWQAAAFRLPVAQQKVSGWWDVPSTLPGLKDSMSPTATSDLQDFLVLRWEKTLALAQVLQVCSAVHGPHDDHQWG